jgi:nicotinamidase-related amidase
MLLDRARSQLLIIDVQARLAPHIQAGAAVVERCGRLIEVARLMGVPFTITEHYPQGLGATDQRLLAKAGEEAPVLGKIEFSCWRNAAIRARIEDLARQGRDQVVVAGMEAHVCVGQTVLSLLGQSGLAVHVVADAVGSREAAARDLALERFRQGGAILVHHEMVAFEWLERGDAPGFKEVLAVIK